VLGLEVLACEVIHVTLSDGNLYVTCLLYIAKTGNHYYSMRS
jgi:hypothetical protein